MLGLGPVRQCIAWRAVGLRRQPLRRACSRMAAAPAGEPGGSELWARICSVYDSATAEAGAASVTPSCTEILTDEGLGIQCVVRVASKLQEKPKAAKKEPGSKPRPNPFLPYEERLWVAHLSPSHTLLLNKFNVVAHHTLVVTRAFEAQEAPLTEADFAATWQAMQAYPRGALAFFNGGGAAGASQAHKHLQVVPLPLAPEVPDLPFTGVEAAALENAPDAGSPAVAVDALPYQCFCAALECGASQGPGAQGAALSAAYQALLEAAGQPPSYNLLLTARRLTLVPRRREACGVVPVNSLGFAGSLFVRSQEELDAVRERGLLQLLAHVGAPWGDLQRPAA